MVMGRAKGIAGTKVRTGVRQEPFAQYSTVPQALADSLIADAALYSSIVDQDSTLKRENMDPSLAQGFSAASQKSLAVLYQLHRRGFLDGDTLGRYAAGFDDWRAIWKLVQAGWALDTHRGLLITAAGRKQASEMFEEHE